MQLLPPSVPVDPVDLVHRLAVLVLELDIGNPSVDPSGETVENVGQRQQRTGTGCCRQFITIIVRMGNDGEEGKKREG